MGFVFEAGARKDFAEARRLYDKAAHGRLPDGIQQYWRPL
jgi:hypothetical protein